MKFLFSESLIVLLVIFVGASSFGQEQRILNPQGLTVVDPILEWAYSYGIDPNSKTGRELINLIAEHPNSQLVSEALSDEQKFRYYFGISVIRNPSENGIKILFIGQDSTHFGEFTRFPGVSGYGGQVQFMGHQLGQFNQVGSTNTVLNTIKGQYGTYNHPYFIKNSKGKVSVRFTNVLNNHTWMLFNDSYGPHANWRNRFIDLLIRHNRDSLELIVTLGGAARDAMASFINAKGGKVLPRISEKDAYRMLVPESKAMYGGGNNQFPVPLDADGKDLYANYFKQKKLDYKKTENQEKAIQALKDNPKWFYDRMVFTGGGETGSGLVNTAQASGFDLDKIYIEGKKTRNLNGLPLNDGTKMGNIIVLSATHPSALARLYRGKGPRAAAASLERDFKVLEPYFKSGELVLDPEKGLKNIYRDEGRVRWGKKSLPSAHFPFGTPLIRKGTAANASRSGPSVINAGTRDFPKHSRETLDKAKYQKPNTYPDSSENFMEAPKGRFLLHFDPGPGEFVAKTRFLNIDTKKLFATKPGKTFAKNGIAAHYTASDKSVGIYSDYRGDFTKPRAVIFADPHGFDDLYTDVALTGTRGQYLHGMMEDLGFEDRYLVWKTVPVGMDGKTAADWAHTLEATATYREKMYAHILKLQPEVIFTDGTYADQELKRIATDLKIPVHVIERSGGASSGIAKVARGLLEQPKYRARMANIPRSHLPIWMKNWVGTSGDRVFASEGRNKGKLFSLVLPLWAYSQKTELIQANQEAIEKVKTYQAQEGVVVSGQNIRDWVKSNKTKLNSCRASFAQGAKF